MTRLAAALAAILLSAMPALADKAPTMLPGSMPSLSQGRAGPQAFAPAPMPNPNIIPPTIQRDPNAIQLRPGLTRTPTGQANSGDGFANGSAYNGQLEKRNRSGGFGSSVAPSLNFKMPLQVDLR